MSDSVIDRRVFIVGVGLIGGSIGLAVRRFCPDIEVIGVGRSTDRLKQAVDAGIVTGFVDRLDRSVLTGRCTVVLCTPVNVICQQLKELAGIVGDETLVTDAGSVKGVVQDTVRNEPGLHTSFVGAHPIAGGENAGFEHGDAGLFDGRVCVVAPELSDDQMVQRAIAFWNAIGCRCVMLTAETHDRLLARTSHLPHVMAALTAQMVTEECMDFAGTGFLDTTRVAAGNAELWTTILAANRQCVVDSLMEIEQSLRQLRTSLAAADDHAVAATLRTAAKIRRRFNDSDA